MAPKHPTFSRSTQHVMTFTYEPGPQLPIKGSLKFDYSIAIWIFLAFVRMLYCPT